MVEIERELDIELMVYGYMLHTRDLLADEYLVQAIDKRCKVLAARLIATLKTHSSFWQAVVARYKGSSVMSGYYTDIEQVQKIVKEQFRNNYTQITFIHPIQAATIIAAMKS